MPSPKDNPELLEEWKNFEADLLSEGFTRYKSHLLIGAQYDVSNRTVHRWLTPGQKEQEKAYNKKYREEKLTKEMIRRYRINHRNKPGVRKKINAYQKRYLNLYRNLGTYVVNLFLEKNKPVGIEEITQTIMDDLNIDMKNETILNAINKYNERQKEPEIHEADGHFYLIPDQDYFDF